MTLDTASTEYALNCFVNNPNVPVNEAFKAGAEWQKEQLKAYMQEVINTLESEFAKQLVENVTNILFK